MPLLRYTKECLDAAQGKWPASGDWAGEDAEKRKDRPKTIRVFENDFIEKVFARSHPILPIVWFGPFIAYGLYDGVRIGGALQAAGLFVVGLLVWTFLEYLLHRFLFHMTARTPEERFRSFMVHGYHHEFPNDKLRLVAPPLMSWPIAAVMFAMPLLSVADQVSVRSPRSHPPAVRSPPHASVGAVGSEIVTIVPRIQLAAHT